MYSAGNKKPPVEATTGGFFVLIAILLLYIQYAVFLSRNSFLSFQSGIIIVKNV